MGTEVFLFSCPLSLLGFLFGEKRNGSPPRCCDGCLRVVACLAVLRTLAANSLHCQTRGQTTVTFLTTWARGQLLRVHFQTKQSKGAIWALSESSHFQHTRTGGRAVCWTHHLQVGLVQPIGQTIQAVQWSAEVLG